MKFILVKFMALLWMRLSTLSFARPIVLLQKTFIIPSVFAKFMHLLRTHLILLVCGIGCELIYLLYFVRRFPVLTYGYGPGLQDLGSITNHSQMDFILITVCFCLLFLLVALAWRDMQQRDSENIASFTLVFAFGSLFIITMAYCYPITAIDVFIYIAQSHVLVTHHANPLLVPASTFASDPLMALAGQWGKTGAPYGPLAILIDALPTWLAKRNVFSNLMLLKGMFAAVLMVNSWLIHRILSHYAPQWALAGTLLFAWNPLMIFEYSANSHNDVLVMLFALLALLALIKERSILAVALLIASISIKYSTIPLLPLFIFYGLSHQTTYRKRILYLAGTIGISAAMLVGIFAPFWAGMSTIESALSHDDWLLSSFSVVLLNIMPPSLGVNGAKLVGRIIFIAFYLYALFLSTRRLPDMIRGSALTMFMFLAFGSVKFEPWYAIWAVALLALVPRSVEGLTTLLFCAGSSLIAIIFSFLWIWGQATNELFAGINSLSYLLTFLPALFVFFGWHTWTMLHKWQRPPQDHLS